MPSKKTTACVSVFVFFTIRLGTFPYSFEDDANTTSQTLTAHYTNTCVKLTIVTHLSFSERIAIANLFLIIGLLLSSPSEPLVPGGASLKVAEFWQSANRNKVGCSEGLDALRLSIVLYVVYTNYLSSAFLPGSACVHLPTMSRVKSPHTLVSVRHW